MVEWMSEVGIMELVWFGSGVLGDNFVANLTLKLKVRSTNRKV